LPVWCSTNNAPDRGTDQAGKLRRRSAPARLLWTYLDFVTSHGARWPELGWRRPGRFLPLSFCYTVAPNDFAHRDLATLQEVR